MAINDPKNVNVIDFLNSPNHKNEYKIEIKIATTRYAKAFFKIIYLEQNFSAARGQKLICVATAMDELIRTALGILTLVEVYPHIDFTRVKNNLEHYEHYKNNLANISKAEIYDPAVNSTNIYEALDGLEQFEFYGGLVWFTKEQVETYKKAVALIWVQLYHEHQQGKINLDSCLETDGDYYWLYYFDPEQLHNALELLAQDRDLMVERDKFMSLLAEKKISREYGIKQLKPIGGALRVNNLHPNILKGLLMMSPIYGRTRNFSPIFLHIKQFWKHKKNFQRFIHTKTVERTARSLDFSRFMLQEAIADINRFIKFYHTSPKHFTEVFGQIANGDYSFIRDHLSRYYLTTMHQCIIEAQKESNESLGEAFSNKYSQLVQTASELYNRKMNASGANIHWVLGQFRMMFCDGVALWISKMLDEYRMTTDERGYIVRKKAAI